MSVFVRRSWRLCAALLFSASIGCAGSDGPSAPVASLSSQGEMSASSGVFTGNFNANVKSGDTTMFDFVINTMRVTMVDLGSGNSVVFPVQSVCDLGSTYGPDQWDRPCTPAIGGVHIRGKSWVDAGGHPHLDFTNDVRFVPSSDARHWVILTFTDASAALFSSSSILYCAADGASCVDESLSDPTLATVRNPYTGTLSRRIKHFSGYEVTAGRDDSSLQQ